MPYIDLVEGSPVATRRQVMKGFAGLAISLASPAPFENDANASGSVVSAWVKFDTDNTVTIASPAAEMGQGSRTALPLIIAEELDLDWASVRVEQSPLDDKIYGNPRFGIMYTAGSASVPTYFKVLRLHAAQVRRVLIENAAAKLKVPESELKTELGYVIHPASKRRLSYGEIATFGRMPAVMPTVRESDLKPASDFRLIGKDVARVDIASKVDGSAKYSIDVRVPGMRYATVLRAPIEGVSPVSFEQGAARAIHGVLDVVGLPYGVGVIADTVEAALAAREKLDIAWSSAPADAFNSEAALDRYVERARDLSGEGKVWDRAGDMQALASAARVVEADYRTDFAYHSQMEPLNAVASVDSDGTTAEVWCGTQAPTVARRAVARALDTTEEKIVLHPMLLGGGFGRRGHFDAEYVVDAVLLSKAAKAPVKVLWTREDDVHNGRFRPMTGHHLKAGLDKDGNIVGWRHRIASEEALQFQDPNRFKARGGNPVFSMLGSEQPSYDLPNRLVDHVLQSDGMRLSSMRGTGNPPNAFVTESFIDEIAAAQNMDPLALRRRLTANVPRAQAVLQTLSERCEWSRKRSAGTGLGMCFRNEDGTLVGMVAEVDVDTKSGEVKVRRVWAVIDPGLAVQPGNIKAQIEGAIIYTMGATLFERITMVNGTVQQNNFYDYRVPRMSDVPELDVLVLSTDNPPTGIGEMGGNVTGAVANAVAAACGARVRHMPLTPQRVKAALSVAAR